MFLIRTGTRIQLKPTPKTISCSRKCMKSTDCNQYFVFSSVNPFEMTFLWHTVRMSAQFCPKASPKIWRFVGWNFVSFKKYQEKAEIQSFPIMYIKGGSTFGLSLQKSAQKQLFLATQIWIKWPWRGLVPPILKVLTFLTCSLKTLGQKLSDELSGSPLASILSDWRPFEIFYQRDTKNWQKRTFFAFQQITWDFDIETHIQGSTMRKLTSWGFRKCIR